jgi:hypothetical protein
VPALSVEIVKQSHDTKGFVVLPRRWVGRHVARRLNIDGDRQGDLVRHGGERRAALYTRSTHPGIGKSGSVEAISDMGNSERISPSTGCPMARCASGIAIASGVPSLKLTQRQRGRIEMEDHDIRAALDRHWAASDANDFEAEHQIYREDAVLEYPQSGERIRGRRKIQSSRAAQPNRKRFTVRRIIGAGDLWVTEFVLTYDGRPSYTVSIMEFLDGKLARETQYFGDPFEPGPSRAQWVERMP